MFIDTNLLLRYLLNDIPEQAAKAAETIADGAQILPETIPEAIYVLLKVYGIPRKDIATTLTCVLDDVVVERKDQIREALKLFGETRLDYVDCLLLAGWTICANDFVSFDKRLVNKKKRLSSPH